MNRQDLVRIWAAAGLLLTQCRGSQSYRNEPNKFGGLARRGRRRRPKDGENRNAETMLSRDGQVLLTHLRHQLETPNEAALLSEDGGHWRRVQWQSHPFGKKMLREIFQHLENIGDWQTLAMLACVFSEHFPTGDGTKRVCAHLKSVQRFNPRASDYNVNVPAGVKWNRGGLRFHRGGSRGICSAVQNRSPRC